MISRYLRYQYALAILSGFWTAPGMADDINDATQVAMKAASARVAPTIVKIETAGGAEVIGGGKKGPGGAPAIRKGVGPTTGLIIGADGYVITSSFNFANKPTDIFVTVPGRQQRLVAKTVAHDLTRMLTLLKVEAKDLPVPTPYSKKGLEVGLWALALGRTSDPNVDHPPSMSVGIVSAIDRIWGKAIQTDAKTSPVNYGGPLVSIEGRVYGVIVPMSNRAEGETAGVDVYDGGIGFAVPLEDVFRVLPRLKKGQDLRRGLLGITPQGSDVYNSPPVIGSILPDSAAARAGLQVGDRILEIGGRNIPNYSTLQHILGPLYEGDEISVKVRRGDSVKEFQKIKLQGTASAYVNAFLGILPMRDDPGPGVEVRYVYPKSPAETAGIKVGDRLMKIGLASQPALQPIQNRASLLSAIQRLSPGLDVKFELRRKVSKKPGGGKNGGKQDGERPEEKFESLTVTARVIAAPSNLPEKLPLPSSLGRAREEQPKSKRNPKDPFSPKQDHKQPECEDDLRADTPKLETGFINRSNAALGREYWLYIPDNYDANRSYGLIIWFHGGGQGGKDGEKMAKVFREICEDYSYIVMGPKSAGNEGWLPSETEMVMQDVKSVLGQYTIDRTRIVAHGMAKGGQMAFYVGFHAREIIRGVATVGAVLGTNPKENVANQPLSFFISGGDKDPVIKDIVASKDLLLEKRFPVVFREMKETGKEYFDAPTFADLVLWLDSLDRI